MLAGGGDDLGIYVHSDNVDNDADALDYMNGGGSNADAGNDTLRLVFTDVELADLGLSQADIENYFNDNNGSNQTVDFRDLHADLALYAKNFENIELEVIMTNTGPDLLAVAYKDNVDDGNGYDEDVDEFWVKVLDTNESGTYDAGDEVILGKVFDVLGNLLTETSTTSFITQLAFPASSNEIFGGLPGLTNDWHLYIQDETVILRDIFGTPVGTSVIEGFSIFNSSNTTVAPNIQAFDAEYIDGVLQADFVVIDGTINLYDDPLTSADDTAAFAQRPDSTFLDVDIYL